MYSRAPLLTPDILKALNLVTETRAQVVTYHDAPPGMLDISRVLRREEKRIFRASQMSDIAFRKKTVVVTDWSLSTNPQKILNTFSRAFFALLIESGFSVYVWQGNQAIQMHIENEISEALDYIYPCPAEKVKQYFSEQYQLAGDDIAVLDYFRLRQILTYVNQHYSLLEQLCYDDNGFLQYGQNDYEFYLYQKPWVNLQDFKGVNLAEFAHILESFDGMPVRGLIVGEQSYPLRTLFAEKWIELHAETDQLATTFTPLSKFKIENYEPIIKLKPWKLIGAQCCDQGFYQLAKRVNASEIERIKWEPGSALGEAELPTLKLDALRSIGGKKGPMINRPLSKLEEIDVEIQSKKAALCLNKQTNINKMRLNLNIKPEEYIEIARIFQESVISPTHIDLTVNMFPLVMFETLLKYWAHAVKFLRISLCKTYGIPTFFIPDDEMNFPNLISLKFGICSVNHITLLCCILKNAPKLEFCHIAVSCEDSVIPDPLLKEMSAMRPLQLKQYKIEGKNPIAILLRQKLTQGSASVPYCFLPKTIDSSLNQLTLAPRESSRIQISLNKSADIIHLAEKYKQNIVEVQYTVKAGDRLPIRDFFRLASLPSMKYLTIKSSSLLAFKKEKKYEPVNFTSLENLRVEGEMINTDFLFLLLQYCPMLKTLFVKGDFISELTIAVKEIRFPLRKVSLYNTDHDRDYLHGEERLQLLEFVLRSSPELQYFSLIDCSKIRNINIPSLEEFLIKKLDKLKNLRRVIVRINQSADLSRLKAKYPYAALILPDEENSCSYGPVKLDGNIVENPKEELTVKRFFRERRQNNPQPRDYRRDVKYIGIIENELVMVDELPTDLQDAPVRWLSGEEFKRTSEKHAEDEKHLYADFKLMLSTSRWRPLVSTHPGDRIKGMVLYPEMLLKFSPAQQTYYVKLDDKAVNSEKNILMNYILETKHAECIYPEFTIEYFDMAFQALSFDLKENEITCEFDTLPERLQLASDRFSAFLAEPPEHRIIILTAFFRRFGSGDSELQLTGMPLINALLKGKKGACRHRAFLFALVSYIASISCRIMTNDCHAYIEVKDEIFGGSRTIDLGGFAAQVIFEEKEEDALVKCLSDLNRLILPNNSWELEKSPPLQLEVKSLQPQQEAKEEKETKEEKNAKASQAAPLVRPVTCAEYTQQLFSHAMRLHPTKRNVLLKFDSAEKILLYHTALLQFYRNPKHYFYIDNLSEIRFETLSVKPDGQYESVASELTAFLTSAVPGDVLAVNFSPFKPDHVGHNTLMDDQRKLCHLSIPPGVIVLGLLDTTDSMPSEDFDSRFLMTMTFPAKIALPTTRFPESCLAVKPADKPLLSINLYGGENWEADLAGRVSLEEKGMRAIPGAFAEAKSAGKKGLEIINGPWGNREFDLFISERLHRDASDFVVVRTEKPCDYEGKYEVVPATPAAQARCQYVLNEHTFSYFIKYCGSHEGKLSEMPGWLEQYAAKEPLDLFVTGPLNEMQWSKLLEKSREYKQTLRFVVKDEKMLPSKMLMHKAEIKRPLLEEKKSASYTPFDPEAINKLAKQTALVIETNDLHYTVAMLKEKNAIDHIVSIDASKSFAAVWETIKREGMTIHYTIGDIWRWLKEGKTVLLKGQFSGEFVARLETLFLLDAHLWITGKKEALKGKLILVTDQANRFTLANAVQYHRTMPADYWTHLNSHYKKSEGDAVSKACAKESLAKNYAQLQTAFQSASARPKRHPLRSLMLLNPHPDIRAGEKKSAADLQEYRLGKLFSLLKNSPHVFLIGPSGTGKSTAILEDLKQFHMKKTRCDLTVCVGMEQLEKWATTAGDTVLFIDEANLEQDGTYDLFEGLHDVPPHILLNGQYIPIRPNQKVIFAGNFSHYANRQQHRFFQNHATVMLFDEWPKAYLEEKVMHPLLRNLIPDLKESDMTAISAAFLAVYAEMKTLNPGEVLTIRNLQVMCWHAAIVWKDRDVFNHVATELAKFVAFDAVCEHLQDEKQVLLEKKLNLQKSPTDYQKQLAKQYVADFHPKQFELTESRHAIVRRLADQLAIREMKNTHPRLARSGQRGLFISGPSGIGKSALILEFLESKGFISADHPDEKQVAAHKATGKCFYHITPTHPDRIMQTLLKAFHEGAVVIIDELNSMVLENKLNALLMGMDWEGRPPEREGFLVIGTGNASRLRGRQELSPALKNRLQLCRLTDYSELELHAILKRKGLPLPEAKELIERFSIYKQHPGRQLPSRLLFRRAEQQVEAKQVEQKEMKLSRV